MQGNGPLIGVLGGMGPLATADFMTHFVKLTAALRDQDHYRSLVYSNPQIPDRSDALLNQGPSPLPGLLDGIAFLTRCGADAIVIPCNTAHYWLSELMAATDIPIISIVEAVAQDLRRRGLTKGPIGILGTRGAITAGVYQQGFSRSGFDVVTPTEAELSDLLEPAIRAIKAGWIGRAEAPIRLVVEAMEARGAVAVVLGCTELPLALPASASAGGAPLIDSTRALAAACVNWAAGFRSLQNREESAAQRSLYS